MELIILKNTNKGGGYQEGVNKIIYKRKITADMAWGEGTKANFKKISVWEGSANEQIWEKVYESESGSHYGISPDKKQLMRGSDHGLYCVASCNWLLDGKESGEPCYAVVEFKDMTDERFEELKFHLSI